MELEYLASEFIEDYSNKSSVAFNTYYNTYKATFVRATNIPIYTSHNYSEKPIYFLSKSKCKAINMPAANDEIPVAWYKGYNGFYPLYYKNFEITDEILEKINKR